MSDGLEKLTIVHDRATSGIEAYSSGFERIGIPELDVSTVGSLALHEAGSDGINVFLEEAIRTENDKIVIAQRPKILFDDIVAGNILNNWAVHKQSRIQSPDTSVATRLNFIATRRIADLDEGEGHRHRDSYGNQRLLVVAKRLGDAEIRRAQAWSAGDSHSSIDEISIPRWFADVAIVPERTFPSSETLTVIAETPEPALPSTFSLKISSRPDEEVFYSDSGKRILRYGDQEAEANELDNAMKALHLYDASDRKSGLPNLLDEKRDHRHLVEKYCALLLSGVLSRVSVDDTDTTKQILSKITELHPRNDADTRTIFQNASLVHDDFLEQVAIAIQKSTPIEKSPLLAYNLVRNGSAVGNAILRIDARVMLDLQASTVNGYSWAHFIRFSSDIPIEAIDKALEKYFTKHKQKQLIK